jgi:hypothetical protein
VDASAPHWRFDLPPRARDAALLLSNDRRSVHSFVDAPGGPSSAPAMTEIFEDAANAAVQRITAISGFETFVTHAGEHVRVRWSATTVYDRSPNGPPRSSEITYRVHGAEWVPGLPPHLHAARVRHRRGF